MMKKLKIFAITLAMITNMGGTALADGIESLEESSGITPDNMLYAADKALESIKLSITFNTKGKVKVLTDIAKERLGESESMVEAGKEELAQGAIDAYSQNMETANEILQQIIAETEGEEIVEAKEEIKTVEEATEEVVQPVEEPQNQVPAVEETTNTTEFNPVEEAIKEEIVNTTPDETTSVEDTTTETTTEENVSDEETTKDTIEETEGDEGEAPEVDEEVEIDEEKNKQIKELEAKIVATQEKAIEVLTAIQEKVSDSAKATILAVIEMQTVKKEAMVQMIEKRHELNAIRQEEAVKTVEKDLNATAQKYISSKIAFKEAFINNRIINREIKELNKELRKDLHEEVKEGNITKEESKEALNAVKTNNGKGQLKKVVDQVDAIKVNEGTKNTVKPIEKVKEETVEEVKKETIEKVKKTAIGKEKKIKDNKKEKQEKVKEKIKQKVEKRQDKAKEQKGNKKNK